MAHKKAGGSSRNGRDSAGRRLGVKLFGGYLCSPRFSSSHWPGIIGRALKRTRLWFKVAVAAQIVAATAHAPTEIAYPIRVLFVIAAVLQAAVWVRALILGLVEYRAGTTDPTGNLQSAMGLIRVLLTAGLFILATILILSNLGVEPDFIPENIKNEDQHIDYIHRATDDEDELHEAADPGHAQDGRLPWDGDHRCRPLRPSRRRAQPDRPQSPR